MNSSTPLKSLSSGATRFLASLHRYPFIPTEQLVTQLSEQGLPTCDAWLAFHERYAGYESKIGVDGMVWGLIHDTNRYSSYALQGVQAEKHDADGQWLVRCADMDPHYTVELNEQGHLDFEYTRYSSFDMFIERSAHLVEFTGKGQVTEYIDTSNEMALEIIATTKRNDALSDQFLELWESDVAMGTRIPGSDSWEDIRMVVPGNSGKTQFVYAPYTPPIPKSTSAKTSLSRIFGKK